MVIRGEKLLIWAQKINYEIPTEYTFFYNFKIFDFETNATLEGKKGFLDLRNGEIWSDSLFLFFKKEGIRIKAKDFKKNALNEYMAKKALITTCEIDCEREKDFPPWSVEIEDLILTPEGITQGELTKFKVKELTLGYFPKHVFFPKIVLPVMANRKTGFLVPNLSQGSRLGLGVQFPFFWALTDQIDFTLSPMYLTKRGGLLDLEGQIKLKKNVEAIFLFRYLNDIWYKSFYSPPEKPKKDKWWIVGKIDYVTSPFWDVHLDFDIVSNKNFLEEFNVGEGGYSRVKSLLLDRFNRDLEDKTQEYRTSKFWINYYKKSFYARLENSYLDYHGTLDKDEVFQPLGKFHLALLPFNFIGPLLGGLSLDYGYYYRTQGYRGHRLNSNLEISYPFRWSFFMSEAKLSYKTSLYNLNEKTFFEDQTLTRNYYEFNLTSYTLLFKDYELFSFQRGFRLLHTLKPYFSYYYRKKPTPTEIPQFDYLDFITTKTNTVEYGLWQFFSLPLQKNLLSLKAYQVYDLVKAERSAVTIKPEERPFSDVYLQIILNYHPHLYARYDTAYNFYGLGIKRHSLYFSLRDILIDRLAFTYQEDKAWNTKQATIDVASKVKELLWLRFYLSRNLLKDENTEMRIEGIYLHQCYLWGLGFTITPKDTRFFFRVELKGLGGYGKEFQALSPKTF
ncbi:MAG: LPS assembly protein LptD [Thermodesulfobacteriaceae bacterium]|nr:LPS assembly protein LptD [Thermodesulfobacteriaceae bacterium]MCX8042117.1 LPS assembly protein LptD [Thermodesulfobacteriaceae bacterium]MDW8136213.1 LPS assembly protein LptD [Thermodesulfobacterium sp.]